MDVHDVERPHMRMLIDALHSEDMSILLEYVYNIHFLQNLKLSSGRNIGKNTVAIGAI